MLKINSPYRGNPRHSSAQAGAFIELLKSFGYKDNKDFTIDFANDTITIINYKMATDSRVIEAFHREIIQ